VTTTFSKLSLGGTAESSPGRQSLVDMRARNSPEGVCFTAGVDRSETGLVAVGGSPLLQQGEATLQRRGKSRTSINRALIQGLAVCYPHRDFPWPPDSFREAVTVQTKPIRILDPAVLNLCFQQ
jgi:hypothetical protein